MRSAWVVAALAMLIPDGAIRVDPGRKQLFLDDYVLERVSNLQRTMHQPQKRGPVVKADRPSDGQSIATFSAPLWVPSEGVYKVVYECRYSDEKTPNRYAWALSKDGVKWTKPNFGLVEFAGSKDNNLFPTPDGLRLFHVVYDPDDPDPQRRYKGFLGASGRRPAVSADGLNWKKLDVPVLPSSDAGTLTYDRQKKMFLGLRRRRVRCGNTISRPAPTSLAGPSLAPFSHLTTRTRRWHPTSSGAGWRIRRSQNR